MRGRFAEDPLAILTLIDVQQLPPLQVLSGKPFGPIWELSTQATPVTVICCPLAWIRVILSFPPVVKPSSWQANGAERKQPTGLNLLGFKTPKL
jgi:hypothetical protein